MLSFSFLMAIFALLVPIFWAHQGNPIIDCFGQGAYVPSEILKGKILYTDISVPYGPISYQLNALLFLIFGENLSTLYIAGIVNSIIILLSIYLIARTITSKLAAWTVSFMIMALCVFNYYIFNYIFPYAYAASYALTTFLLSVLFCVYYLKTSKPAFFGISLAFMFLSIFIKIDSAVFLPVLIAIGLFFKSVSKKNFALSSLYAMIIPAISWVILLYQGLNIGDVFKNAYYLHKFSDTQVFKYFYQNFTGLYFNPALILNDIMIFLQFAFIFAITTGIVYLFLMAVNKLGSLIKFKIPDFACILLATAFIYLFLLRLVAVNTSDISFSWLPISTTVILLIFTIPLFIFKINAKNYFSELFSRIKKISLKDKIFILLCLAGIISALRSYYFLNLHIFGTFLMPLLLLVNVVYFVDYIPDCINKKIKSLDKNSWKQASLIVLIATGFIFTLKYQSAALNMNSYPLKTERGSIYVEKNMGIALNEAKKYINENISPDETFLMLPQGPVLNFMTNRSSGNNLFFDIIPPTVETYGEDAIIKSLQKNAPDYIFINNRDSSDWGFPFFGQDYALKIFDYIKQNYKFEKEVGNEFKIKIYKKKK